MLRSPKVTSACAGAALARSEATAALPESEVRPQGDHHRGEGRHRTPEERDLLDVCLVVESQQLRLLERLGPTRALWSTAYALSSPVWVWRRMSSTAVNAEARKSRSRPGPSKWNCSVSGGTSTTSALKHAAAASTSPRSRADRQRATVVAAECGVSDMGLSPV
ncbi:hypothetical protein AQJ46_00095 [Streptomyces canus]|uniref:Uncharacterized protein n=1 Tax=Streptomyces canus TaxID=58343 RepID=A0A101SHN7_9ACTN|nr:hypothetical protein AQJ46_00095 [Streptomyces canus]